MQQGSLAIQYKRQFIYNSVVAIGVFIHHKEVNGFNCSFMLYIIHVFIRVLIIEELMPLHGGWHFDPIIHHHNLSSCIDI